MALNFLRYLLMLAAILPVFAACGGSDGSDGGGDVREQLTRMVLRLEDLPSGYTEEKGDYSENEDVALGNQEKLARLEEQGRILGYDTAFPRGDVSEKEAPFVGVDSSVSLYETAEGASASWKEAVEEARSTDWAAVLDFGDTRVEEVQRSIGEETVWIRVTGVVELGEEQTPILVIDDQILIRDGRARGFLRSFAAIEGSSDRAALIDDVAALAEQQVRRMREALGK